MSEEYIEEAVDPFSAEGAPGVQLIVQLRILDVLYALLTDADPEKAANLLELHQAGKLLGPQPYFDGSFLFDSQPG